MEMVMNYDYDDWDRDPDDDCTPIEVELPESDELTDEECP
jgi:hypothetical protein